MTPEKCCLSRSTSRVLSIQVFHRDLTSFLHAVSQYTRWNPAGFFIIQVARRRYYADSQIQTCCSQKSRDNIMVAERQERNKGSQFSLSRSPTGFRAGMSVARSLSQTAARRWHMAFASVRPLGVQEIQPGRSPWET